LPAIEAKPGPLEQSMIDEADAEKENLRLSCQIPVTEALDGLAVRIPTKQF
jgi:ferredoxin